MKTKNAALPMLCDRTRFGDIVAEFWQPRKPSQKAIIICDGCPSVPSKSQIGEFFAKKGYWVFHIRYRGTWESDGEFLRVSPHEDVLHVATRLNLGFTGLYTKETYVLDIQEVDVLGASFGGTAAILASTSQVIRRVVAIAPVIDWRDVDKHSAKESFVDFVHMLEFGFPGAYRGPKRNLSKLKNGKFYNPISLAQNIDPRKLFVIHALDDEVVPVGALKKFAKLTGVKPHYMHEGGHLSSRIVIQKDVWKQVRVFLKS